MRHILSIMSLLVFTTVAYALSLRPQSQLELVGTSDLIVVGTILSTNMTPSAEDYRAGSGTATVAVERIIKGTDVKAVELRYPTPPRTPGMDWGKTLEKGEKVLFFLVNRGGRYTLVTPQGIQSPDTANQVAELAGHFPVEVTMSRLAGVTPGKAHDITVTIRNKDVSALIYQGIRVTVLLITEKDVITLDVDQPRMVDLAGKPEVLIEPGQAKNFTVTFTPLIPTTIGRDNKPFQIEIRASAWLRIKRPEDKSRGYLENIPITLGFYVSTSRSITGIRKTDG
ncbi:MAG: hypothetical protein ACYC7E_12465 [Armatimonadota bacterium]